MNILAAIQSELKAPKSQFNKFGGYNYRNAEDILEALKPILAKHEAYLTISDDIVQIGERFYVKATATLHHEGNQISTSAFAREPLDRKGMDRAMCTGSSSSYARKYCLNGLFLIDDTKDPDTTHNSQEIKRITEEQQANIQALLDETNSDVTRFKRWLKIDEIANIQAAAYEKVIRTLERKRQ